MWDSTPSFRERTRQMYTRAEPPGLKWSILSHHYSEVRYQNDRRHMSWPAATSFPVVAGTFSVLAIMFNICALSQGWRQVVETNGSISIMYQPAWAVVLKATSLASGVVAQVVLLLTMISKRDPVKGLVVTILCWCISAIILLSVIGVTATHDPALQPQQMLRYSQNFFYGTFAAGLYILIAVLLATYAGNMHSAHLTLEERQIIECRSIILRVFAFAAFLLGGAAVYAAVEGWSFMDALYWADYTLLTVGIGNIAPQTHLGRSLLFPYVSAGLMNAGLIIRSISSFTENMRELGMKLKITELRHDMQSRQPVDEPAGNTGGDKEKQTIRRPMDPHWPNQADIRRLQQIKHEYYRRHRRMTLVFSGLAWFLLWLVSAAIFGRSERTQGWSYFTSLYFTFTSLTTIGYGDVYPTSNFGKAFFVFWSLLAVPALTNLVASMGQSGFEWLTWLLHYRWRRKPSELPNQFTQNGNDHDTTVEFGKRKSRTVLDSRSHASGPSEARKSPSGGPRGSATCKDKKSCEALIQAIRCSLSLGEETVKLISILQSSSSTDLDLPREWATILALLHPEYGEDDVLEVQSLTSLYHHTELLDSHMSAIDRDKEILWMLRYLVEMICSHLQEGLQSEEVQVS